MKRVLLFVVDGCTSRVLRRLVDDGALPTIAALGARGTLAYDCLSIFPSITPAATASIVTGCYPQDHGIAGMSWWDSSTDRVSYYGDDVWTVLQRGVGTFVRDFLLRLNGERLRAPTIFQTAERHGRRAGCINHLIFRGDAPHAAHMPTLLSVWPGVPSDLRIHGPSLLCLGDFVSEGRRTDPSVKDDGLFNRFGLDDQGTEDFLLDFTSVRDLPDVTVAYFADYDFDSHDRGPEGATDTLRRVDGRLASVFDAWGGLDRVLEDACIMLTADHAHSDVFPGDRGRIVLEEHLSDYRQAGPGSGWNDEEIMVCPNMRAAEIYFRRGSSLTVQEVCSTLLQDPRIDQVIWREPGEPRATYCVATRDRGELRFSIAAGGEGDAQDAYHASWHMRGDLSAIDARASRSGSLMYGTYPNALERIACSLAHQPGGRVLATACPGHEFGMAGQSVHSGAGSHGTLHELDSRVPLLVAGAPEELRIPQQPRIVDVEPLCRALLDISGGIPPGASHTGADVLGR